MKTFLSLLSLGVLSVLTLSLSSCVASPPSEQGGVYEGPSIQQKQIQRQEAISRQQRSLMR